MKGYVLVTSFYYILDSAFIICRPEIVRAPTTILLHHLVAFLGVYGLAYHFCWVRYTMVDATLADINTWFLVLRQYLKKKNTIVEILFYASWVCIRMLYYPYILFKLLMQLKEGAIYVVQADFSVQVIHPDIKVQLVVLLVQTVFGVLNVKWTYDLFKKALCGKTAKNHYL